jgi:hypothetical protein
MNARPDIYCDVETLSAEAATLLDRLTRIDSRRVPSLSTSDQDSIPYHLSVARARARSAAQHLAAIRAQLRRHGPVRA